MEETPRLYLDNVDGDVDEKVDIELNEGRGNVIYLSREDISALIEWLEKVKSGIFIVKPSNLTS